MSFAGNPVINYGTSSIPKLVGWKFNHTGMEKGFLCNFSADTFALSLASVFTHPMQFDQYSADTNFVVTGMSSLNRYSGSSSDTLLLYPYSITQISSAITTGS